MRLSAIALSLLAAGCADDFSPPSALDGPRVLAILADPLEVGPGEEVSVTAAIYRPAGVAAAASWSFCPLTTPGGECALAACETPLAADADGAVRADPSALAAACASAAGLPPVLPPRLDTRFRLTLETGQVADQRVPLHAAPPDARNTAPLIIGVDVERSGGDLLVTARIDPASLDAFVDAAGRSRTEEPITSFYVTSGELDADRAAGVDATVVWTPAGEAAELYAVTRDRRGGQTVAGPITLGP